MADTGLPENTLCLSFGIGSFRPGLNLVGLLLSSAGTDFAWLFFSGGEPVRRWLLIDKQSLCRSNFLLESLTYKFAEAIEIQNLEGWHL